MWMQIRDKICSSYPSSLAVGAPFPGQVLYEATKPGVILSMLYTESLFIRACFYVLIVFIAMHSVFQLFRLSCQYLP